MPQGHKKSKIPEVVKKKLQKKGGGNAFTRRPNAPIQKKKTKLTEQDKIKQVISKKLNKNAENELRSLAVESNLNLSKAQKAVKKIQELPKGDKMET
ncbi:uncharacterized protein LOC129610156 [Condylostylus longicornis]|uniref:uncharacterized protein LOC129610156 n=1 Tax=Condylostylus longicornis TaxID=2530218 RepID=UPI00244DA9BD|nr:uncharacterized protein LOC129610156 [Condylostylus longicornis]